MSAAQFDFEEKSTYSIRIETNDGNSNVLPEEFSILITDENDEITEVFLNPSLVLEGQDVGHTVGILSAEDQDQTDFHIFTLIVGVGDTDNVSFSIDGPQLITGEIFDIDVKDSYSIRLLADDQMGSTLPKIFTITVSDGNIPPTDIILSNNTIEENQPIGTVVGALSTVDQNEDSHTYTLMTGGEDFSIDGDQLLTNKVFSVASVTSINITIQSDDGNGGSLEKDFVISVSEGTDIESPVISAVNLPDFFEVGAGKVTLTVSITDNVGLGEVLFTSRGITEPITDFEEQTPDNSENNFSVELAEVIFDNLGLEYSWDAIDLSGNSTQLEGQIHLRFPADDIESIPNLIFGGTQNSYQVISLPYNVTDNTIGSIFDELGGFDKTRWRLLRHRSDGVSLDEFTQGLTRIEPGFGYWLNIKEQTTIEIGQRNAVRNTQDDPFAIPLVPGWNQIGNPYPFDVPWSTIVDFNQSPDELGIFKIFNNGDFDNGSTLKSYGGGFVRWEGESNFELRIPVDAGAPNRRLVNKVNTNSLDEADWEVQLFLSSNSLKNEMSGFGMHSEANLSKDRYDDIVVPRLFNYLEVNFSHPEYKAPKFSKDIIPLNEEYVWAFETATNLKETITLSWENHYWGDNTLELMLLDRKEQKIINMRDQTTYSFHGSDSRLFNIYFGNEDFIDRALKPQWVTLGTNFPNPFSDHTIIPITLPHAESDYQINLSIYHISGQKIQTLVDGKLTGGFYQIPWDVKTLKGVAASRGIYVIKLEVKNQEFSQRLTQRMLIK